MKISVTPADIESGRAKDAGRCPIALALRRLLPNERLPIYVGTATIEFTVEDGSAFKHPVYIERDLPEEAKQFVFDFDCQQTVVPFEFFIHDLPKEVMDLGSPQVEATAEAAS